MTATEQPDPFGSDPVPSSGPSGPRAGFWDRFGAALIDGVLLYIVFAVFAFGIDLVVGYAMYLVASIVYHTYFEGGPTGQTLGKKALRVRVIDLAQGGSIGFGRAFIRYIGRIASSIPLWLGYFWMLWDPEKQTWHDKMAGSVVVPTSSYPVG